MRASRQQALYVALLVIALTWLYQLDLLRGGVAAPASFAQFAWAVAIKKLVVVAFIVSLLRLAGEGPDALGLTRREWPKHLAVGLGLGAAMFIVFNVGLASVLGAMLPRSAETSATLAGYFHDPGNLLLWLPIGILGGGVVEELERIFILTRFEHWLGKAGLVLGVVSSSVMFGLGHLYQGPGVALGTGLSGAVLALIYLRRRNALEPIAAHAISDVFAVLAATFMAHPQA